MSYHQYISKMVMQTSEIETGLAVIKFGMVIDVQIICSFVEVIFLQNTEQQQYSCSKLV
jgi:hypothetical protein